MAVPKTTYLGELKCADEGLSHLEKRLHKLIRISAIVYLPSGVQELPRGNLHLYQVILSDISLVILNHTPHALICLGSFAAVTVIKIISLTFPNGMG